jgi:SAM-dependent methyltransferase
MALPRRTFKNYASCLAWTKGEPTEDNGGQIYEYPDFQPRLYIHTRFMKMFRSPHHLTLNQGEPFNIIDADILHYEKEKPELMPSHNDTWESMIRRGKELGLDKWYWDHTLERSKAVKITAELIGGDLEHKINKVKDIGNKPFQRWEEEFNVVKAFIKGKGIDLGCGTDRLSPTIISMDAQPDRKFAFADIVGDCSILSSFSNFCFDFVFSSHCIEDFPPERHLEIIKEWLRVIKPQGYLCLIIPDMEGNRYPRAGDPKGNLSHKADVGLNYFKNLLKNEKVELIQADTIPHKYCSLDLVYKKL